MVSEKLAVVLTIVQAPGDLTLKVFLRKLDPMTKG